ncbi:glycine betaine ABC transporter substrate-binding protein [Salimicrobium album]|uniref:Glycine betaine/proline transport system substrate-binding protein n=1 Tax=Salimicrobium album TaxID=50717 RepID=A0A1H3AER2_9BACI|nr:glycine betaine ABC transporter substrate-binding protein [Salimicrobium album]SDX27961.1 glycine betaine/proline transport system substrate-binding protein [Salimicrobium album]
MKKITALLFFFALLMLAACGSEETQSNEESNNKEETADTKQDETITFGATTWTSTQVPTAIASQILEEAGYQTEITTVAQPLIFEGLANKDMDVFMDAWLPHTEEELWNKYKDSLQKVTASYKEVPLGWVVPEYMEADSIEDLKGKSDQFTDEVVTIGAGAGIVEISKDIFPAYGLDDYELVPTSESAMMGVVDEKTKAKEPFIITGWRPHSMFQRYDLKFLEESKDLFKYDNVYVLSYQGLEEKHPEAYNILSNWEISVEDLEEMMLKYEKEDKSFEELAQKWIEDNRDKVETMLKSSN